MIENFIIANFDLKFPEQNEKPSGIQEGVQQSGVVSVLLRNGLPGESRTFLENDDFDRMNTHKGVEDTFWIIIGYLNIRDNSV